MRNIILNLALTLDGYIEGPSGEIDWCIMEEDMHFDRFIDSIDTIFYGRVSYDAWGNYQPEENSSREEKALWQQIHSKNKIVFSRSDRVGTKDRFISSDMASQVAAIKEQPGKDIWLYGGARLTKAFLNLDLIDIFKLSIHPVALGKGKALFEDLTNRIQLKLTGTRVFKSGVIELSYEAVRRPA